jgi:hypothetical protein
MSIRMWFVCTLVAGTALAQSQNPTTNATTPPTSAPAQTAPAAKMAPKPAAPAGQEPASMPQQKPEGAAAEVAPGDVVITIQGICSSPAKPAAGKSAGQKSAFTTAAKPCVSTLTRKQFEQLAELVAQPGQTLPPAARQRLAQSYVELLTISDAATKAGVESTARYKTAERLMRMQTLAQMYNRELNEKFSNPTQAELEAYYQSNAQKYEQVKLQRIFIPRNDPSAKNKEEFESKAKAAAEEIHDKVAKGEEPDKLLQEAYTSLGLSGKPMGTDWGTRRRTMLPPQMGNELFALKPGEVTKVTLEGPGFVFYKVVSKGTAPLDETLKSEISNEIQRQEMTAKMQGIKAKVHAEFNEKYFGQAAPLTPAMPGPPGAPRPAVAPIPKPVPGPSPSPSPSAAPVPGPSPSPH